MVYPPYVPKKQAKYGHHPFVMPKNEVHGRVGQPQPDTLSVGHHKAKHEKNAETFRAQYPDCYTGEA